MSRLPHIILVGLMGSGKSSVGRLLARRTGWLYSDTDAMVEAFSRRTIPEIFANDGENGFREIEEEMIELAVQDKKPGIIATGGGAVCSANNRRLIKHFGYVVYLQARAESLFQRLKRDTSRPLLQNADPLSVLENLLQERERYYSEAHLIVSVDNRPVRSVASEIWKNYCEQYPAARTSRKRSH